MLQGASEMRSTHSSTQVHVAGRPTTHGLHAASRRQQVAPVSRLQRQTECCSGAQQLLHTKPAWEAHHPLASVTSPAQRRHLLLAAGTLIAAQFLPVQPVSASQQVAQQQQLSPAALDAFKQALALTDDLQAQDQAWSRVIQLAPQNSIAWSNRGTLRLQQARWAEAEADLRQAVALEARLAPTDAQGLLDANVLEPVDPSTLNNLGNAEVALGRLEEAQVHFQAASKDPGMRSIALQNLALAAFEGRDDQLAIRVAKQILRRDPAFLDARCALVAFLYADGQTAAAEGQFDELQNAEDGVGAILYNRRVAIARVQNRWPPRATAALDAFLQLSKEGSATGYDMQPHSYSFGQAT